MIAKKTQSETLRLWNPEESPSVAEVVSPTDFWDTHLLPSFLRVSGTSLLSPRGPSSGRDRKPIKKTSKSDNCEKKEILSSFFRDSPFTLSRRMFIRSNGVK